MFSYYFKIIKRGDILENYFIKNYKKFHNDIYRIAYSYTLNVQDSEDILQKTFIKFYKNITKFQNAEDDYIKRWLFKVAVNEAKDFLKSFWRTHKTDSTDFENIKSTENGPANYELLSALNNIDKKYRIPFYLYYYEGYDIKEIADIMKLSESAIKSRLSRVKDKLKSELEEK